MTRPTDAAIARALMNNLVPILFLACVAAAAIAYGAVKLGEIWERVG